MGLRKDGIWYDLALGEWFCARCDSSHEESTLVRHKFFCIYYQPKAEEDGNGNDKAVSAV